MMRYLVVFIAVVFASLMVITYVPGITLFLRDLVYR
jgi:TRAP-type C4-dicarboxylate transport system permease large subunit